MKRKLAAIFAALACASTCFALDITTRSGTAYRHCEVIKVEPDGIRISHATGAAKISFEELPDALQRQYGYDAAKAAAYRKTIADEKTAAEAKAALARQQAAEAIRKQASEAEIAKQKDIALRREKMEAPERERLRKENDAQAESKRLAKKTVKQDALLFVGVLFFYFLPSVVGVLHGKSNGFAIGILNLFLGWTLVGWVVALVWALTKDREPNR